MQKTTYETMSPAELASRHDLHWTLALEALQTPYIEGLVLPYRTAMRVYEQHVDACSGCQDSPVWDIGCETGNALAHEAADAMSRQDELAELN
jgi:hypothetical protein